MRQLGHRIGETLIVDVHSAENAFDRLPSLAARALSVDIDLLLAVNTPAANAAIPIASGKPVVVGIVADPMLLGFVTNLARPGANVTGVSNMASELAPKRLEVFKEAVPGIRRILAHFHPEEPIAAPQIADLDAISSRFGVEFRYRPVRTAEDVDRAFQDAAAWPADAMLRLAGQGLALSGAEIAAALRHQLPAMPLSASGVRAGGLVSYFADHSALWRRAAHQVHRILGGTPAGEIPFERPTKFDLAVNLGTARKLGITLPPEFLQRADEVVD